MASLGSFLLLFAFVVSAYAAAMSVVGARRGSRPVVESGVGAYYLSAALLTIASIVIMYAFVSDDYAIKYVQHNSDSAQPIFYKLTAFWGGLDGSILFWVLLLGIFGSTAVRLNRERHRELIPYVVAVLGGVQMFFLLLIVVHNNPFDTYLTQAPADGRGMNPLLQTFYMAIHPPMLYLGFTGLAIPYAFGMAALITGHLDDSWLRAVRRWTMVAWLFLTFGLILGMIWAYEELGWGGYWGWDPVENAGLLPWFTATAFLHSVMVQERRGMLRVWNVTLVIITFLLTIFGTFMTRSGVVQSVHAFGEDRQLAMLFTAFMASTAVFSFGWVIYRLPLLRARHELDSWVSREAAFLANNWILLFSAMFILFATMFPTLSETVTGERLTVGPPFFNKWMLPIGLVLLLLTGIGPLLAWRKSTIGNLVDQFLWPTLLMAATAVGLYALGVRVWASGICFALCAFVFGTVAQEFWRGARVRQDATSTDVLTAMIGLVSRNKRRYGGYVIHLGIVLVFLGFAGDGFKQEAEVQLAPGQQATVGHFTVRLDAVKVTDDGQKQMVTGHVSTFEDGKAIGRMYPAKWFFRKHEEQPTTEVAIRRAITEDLYLVMPAFDLQNQTASLHIVVNPLVNWIWIGFGIMAAGTLVALLPETVLSFAAAHVPGGAVTTSVLLLSLVLWPAAARAQGGVDVQPRQKSALQRQLEGEINCTCGCRATLKDCPMTPNCHGLEEQLPKLERLIAEGKNHDEIIAAFVTDYGSQEILAAPIDKGFNRLAWLFPYVAGIGGLLIVSVVATRWARRRADGDERASVSQEDETLKARLDDELRNLD